MKEVPAKEPSPGQSWSGLIEKTMSVNPVTHVIASAAQGGREDPWVALINRLWEANPYSNVLPIDLDENSSYLPENLAGCPHKSNSFLGSL